MSAIRTALPMLLIPAAIGCSRSPADPESGSVAEATVAAVPVAQGEPADLIDLRLHVTPGQRLPLIKTVRQTVDQSDGSASRRAETEIRLHMILTVAAVDDQTVTFDVHHTRVQFVQDGHGRRIVYDSDNPPRRLPSAAVPFAGLPGNGYTVTVGHDHRIRSLTGHETFLQRCVSHVPPQRRPFLLSEIAVRFGDEGVAGFIPDTIGLLPWNSRARSPELAARVQPGDSWKHERQLMQPFPVHLRSTCRVVRASASHVELDIAGRVTPGTTYTDARRSRSETVRILGGTTSGICVIDRHTSLPIDVRRTEMLRLEIILQDGTAVHQDKTIDTSVRLFPEERGPIVTSPPSSAPAAVVPASGQADRTSQAVRPIPTHP